MSGFFSPDFFNFGIFPNNVPSNGGATEFTSAIGGTTVVNFSGVRLSDGNIGVVWEDTSDDMRFAIINGITGATEYSSGVIANIFNMVPIAIKASDGNLGIAYGLNADADGYYAIYSQAGATILAQTKFTGNITVGNIAASVNNAGNFVMTVRDGNFTSTYIWNQSGSQVSSPLVVGGNGRTYRSASLTNGDVVCVFKDTSTPPKGKMLGITPTNTQQFYNEYVADVIHPAALDIGNNKFVIAYGEQNDGYDARFRILNHDGTLSVGETIFDTQAGTAICEVVNRENGADGFCVVWHYDGTAYQRTYDDSGSLVTAESIFATGITGLTWFRDIWGIESTGLEETVFPAIVYMDENEANYIQIKTARTE